MNRPRLRVRGGPRTDALRRVRADGGLGQVPAGREPDSLSPSVCGFCSVGCSLDVHRRGREAVGLTPSPTYPVNRGSACPKGWEALVPMSHHERATSPLLRTGGQVRPVAWNVAFEAFRDGVRGVQERHGPDSVAFLSTGQIVTEEMALLGALAKFGLGMVHGDGNTRQCMATSVAAYKECFGFDAPPYAYADLEESDVIVLVGSNLAIAHPILWERLMRNPHSPSVIVIDPRYTETAAGATHHLPIAPKSDLVLLYALARRLIEVGAVDEDFVAAHTSGFEGFRAHVASFPLTRAASATGLSEERISAIADEIAQAERASFWWTMGVNQSHQATRTAQAIIGLALMTGNIGRPGTGANSITGQCNAMGSRLFSNTASLFGGRDFRDPVHRREVAEVLGLDPSQIPDRPSLAYDQILDGIATGAIRGLWVIATNPAHSWINHTDLHDLLNRLEFLVVQDLYADTETARRAHLFLPAAGWSEKEGTFINSERRIGRVRASRRPPGGARTDFEIFQGIAEFAGCGPLLRKWRTPEAVFGILQELSRGRPCDITGIDGYEGLANGGVQWPALETAGITAGTERRLFADGRFFTPDGRARFVWDDPRPLPERPTDAYPLVLLTGRGSTAQWHTQTRTRRSAVLASLGPAELHLELSPLDAADLDVESGDQVEVASRRGRLDALAWVTPTVQPGQVFLPMHDERVNALTFPAVDPHSRQPAYKAAAVRLRKRRRSTAIRGPAGSG